MAVSAFKSTTRRATSTNTSTTPPLPASTSASSSSGGAGNAARPTRYRSGAETAKKVVPPRRSRSVSAFSRTNLSVDSDFANKRDNPLYWSADVDSPRLDGVGAVKVAKFDGTVSRLSGSSSKVSSGVSSSAGGESRRGRSVTRYTDAVRGESTVPARGGGGGGRKDVGRSLSTVDTGRRRRSLSRGHHGNSESERERGSTTLRSRSKTDSNVSRINAEGKSAVARSDSDLSELLKQWEDGGSMSSFSDAEERIGKPMSELLNAMRRSSSSSTLSTDISDIALEVVNPAETELVLEVRGEYARKLEESQERARKLRAELAVEEHREVELNNILVDMVEHPEKPDVKKPRAVRKASMERRKMSRRLEEEALAYFDECVSISTFDGSDFSSPEDPLSNIVGSERHGNRMIYPSGSASISVNSCPVQIPDPSNQMLPKNTTSFDSSSNSSPSSSNKSWKRQFSFSDKQKDSSALKQELRSYVKIFTKDEGEKESSNSRMVNRNRHDLDEYAFSIPTEKFLLEKITLKYRIDSGGMLLCGGATGFPLSPFSNVL
ncbi:hypothetical protein V2J09_013537 [Rumex salicifolius]